MAVFVIVIGVGLFGVVTSFLANRFLPAGNVSEASANMPATPEDTSAILEQISRLRAEQKQSYASFNAKLEALHALLDNDRP